MATITIHQWRDAQLGLRELRRVARGPVAILTFDGDAIRRFWLAEYVPEMLEAEARRYPLLAGEPIPIPLDCEDGFVEAFYGRPEAYLDPEVRSSQSSWGFGPHEAGLERLRVDLERGAWDARHGHLRTQPFFDGSLRLVVA